MAQSPSAFRRAVARMFAKQATIAAVDVLVDRFVEITLVSPAFCGVAWTPGSKVQIAMGSVFKTRTYTPIEWDAEHGRIRIVGFLHGEGLGTAWLRAANQGDSCHVLGPRHSLDVRIANGPIVFCGDETSVGLAYAVSRANSLPCSYRFEASNADALDQVVEAWGLRDVAVIARAVDDAHLHAFTAAVPALAAAGATYILTGKAQTIQRIKTELKSAGVSSRCLMSKAYWSPGKAGLD